MTDFAFSKFSRSPIAIGTDFFCAESGASISDDRGFLLRSGYYADAASYPEAADLEHCKISGIAATNAQSYLHLQSADNGAGTIVMTYSGASGSNVLVSTDNGVTWANVSTGFGGGAATGVVWTGSRFIVAGNGDLYFYARYSTNGTSWSGSASVAHTGVTAGSVRLAYNGTIVYGVGSNSNVLNASAFTTTDGSVLTGRTAPGSGTLSGIAGANGVFVYAFRSPSFYTSTDGISWTPRSATATVELSAYLAGQWILKPKYVSTYYVTSNFTSFVTRTIPGSATGLQYTESLSFDSSRVYVGVRGDSGTAGAPMVMWSNDLISWFVRGLTSSSTTNTVWHCHSGKYFFAKGETATTSILRTTDFTVADYVGAALMTATPNVSGGAFPSVMYRKLAD